MDDAGGKPSAPGAGVSIRNGPILEDHMDFDTPTANGNTKRKARSSNSKPVNYAAAANSDSDDEIPLVRAQLIQYTILSYLLKRMCCDSLSSLLLGYLSKLKYNTN